MTQPLDVAIVGGGLAGLCAGARLAQEGRRVAVFEKAAAPGGRARTLERSGFRLNLGPHALFADGAARRVLADLGVRPAGRVPALDRALAWTEGGAEPLPTGLLSLLTSRVLPPRAALEVLRTLRRLASEPGLDEVAFEEWRDRTLRHPAARGVLTALARLVTYDGAPGLSVAALAERMRAARRGVLYLDGGWQTIVDGLLRVGRAAGLQVRAGAPVVQVEPGTGLRLADGTLQPAAQILIAADPSTAARLTGERIPSLRRAAATAEPVLVATLDVGLRRLPRPRATFALGIERPLYFSVHSAAARLAPEGGALIHLAAYRGGDPGADPEGLEAELLTLLDAVQPGWRTEVVERRFAPHLRVAQDRAAAARGGLRGRPDVAVPEVASLFVAGDWVGPDGLIADAAAASAERAAQMILARREAWRAA